MNNPHHKREEGTSKYLFRPMVLVEEVERVECLSEEEAISNFFTFLNSVGPNVVLVGLDEETVGQLVQKLKAMDKVKFRSLVAGYTWWGRILKHTGLNHK